MSLSDAAAIRLLRQRRAHWFLGDTGPSLPVGASARWRITPHDPHGWQSNMVGFIESPPVLLEQVLATAVAFFGEHNADTWVDLDEGSLLWGHPDLLRARGFVLVDNWDVMLCRELQPGPDHSVVLVDAVTAEQIRDVAWVGEQVEHSEPMTRYDLAVHRRFERYWNEYRHWQTEFVLATLDGRPVGAARLTDEQLPVVVGVATVPHARGRGVATAVTAYLTARALERKGAAALYVERDSEAHRIYRRLGYVPLYRNQIWQRIYQPVVEEQ